MGIQLECFQSLDKPSQSWLWYSLPCILLCRAPHKKEIKCSTRWGRSPESVFAERSLARDSVAVGEQGVRTKWDSRSLAVLYGRHVRFLPGADEILRAGESLCRNPKGRAASQ